MIDVGNHRHVTDVVFTIHDLTDLVYRKIHLYRKKKFSLVYKQKNMELVCD